MIRHVDCQLYFNIMWNRYKAVIYLNGVKVKEMFDFSLPELRLVLQPAKVFIGLLHILH